jgi:3-hydroxyacyl-[acyl-carrier-protein] dehydratase
LINIDRILEYLPHRYPMLLVDRIIDFEPGKRCKGLKNVTMNEPFFQGHYPAFPVMPGVLIIEAMAQAGAVILLSDPDKTGLIPLLGGIDDVKFKRSVVPGDQLITDVELLWFRNRIGKVKCVGSVDGQMVASMELTFKLIPKDS